MDKHTVREQCKAYRSRLTADEYAGLCRQIGFNLAGVPELDSARVVHAYWPHLAAREVDIRPVLCYLRALGHTIGLPVVDFASDEPRLIHREWTSESDLVANRWGLLEPSDGRALPLSGIDVVLVPALGLDRDGRRVGFGKGYYDRFLVQVDAVIICPIFAACIVECIKTEPHDVSVDVSVTEYDVMRPTSCCLGADA